MKPISKVVLATDFSDISKKAADMARDLKDKLGCHLDVLHVFDPAGLVMAAPYGSLGGVDTWLDEHFSGMEKRGRGLLDELCPSLGPGCAGFFVQGHPGPEICSFAAEHEADMIVMGTHGYGTVKGFLMGSVAQYVLHHAPCPVLTVKARD